MSLILLLASAFTGFFLSWILWLSALGIAPASLLVPIRGAAIPFAFLLSVALLRERPTSRSALGVVLVFGGVVLISLSR